jgi:hypothetical protein
LPAISIVRVDFLLNREHVIAGAGDIES